jgi:hypothetical protein
MSSRPKTDRVAIALAAACILGALNNCSDPGLYLDRRDSIALGAGDAVATNAALQTIDPWPPASGNTHIAANGQRMQSAVERYRNGTVTPPVDPMMLQVANQSPATPPNGGAQTGGSTAASAPSTSTAGGPAGQ